MSKKLKTNPVTLETVMARVKKTLPEDLTPGPEKEVKIERTKILNAVRVGLAFLFPTGQIALPKELKEAEKNFSTSLFLASLLLAVMSHRVIPHPVPHHYTPYTLH